MKVKELIEMLKDFKGDEEVTFKVEYLYNKDDTETYKEEYIVEDVEFGDEEGKVELYYK